MMNVHCALSIVLTAGLTAVAVTFAGQSRLGKPIGAVVGLIAALPAWMTRGIFAYPLIPAGGPTKPNSLAPTPMPIYLKRFMALYTCLDDAGQFCLAGTSTHPFSQLGRPLLPPFPFQSSRPMLSGVASPTTKECRSLNECRRPNVEGFTAGDAVPLNLAVLSEKVTPAISTSLRAEEARPACLQLKFKGSAAAVANGSRQFPLLFIHGYDYYSEAVA